MKSLDEVIKALEICSSHLRCMDGCPYYRNECPLYEMEKDALHYLKAFREMEDELNDIRREYIEQMKNQPLTWDELRQMEGKPVWIEHLCGVLRWGVIDDLFYDRKEEKTKIRFGTRHGFLEWDKDDQGKAWQAYRKERG